MSQHQHTDKVLSDIQNTVDHLNSIKKMIEEHQSCLSVLSQLSGIFIRLAEVKITIVNDHIKSCVSSRKLDDPNQLSREIEQILKVAISAPSSGSFH